MNIRTLLSIIWPFPSTTRFVDVDGVTLVNLIREVEERKNGA